MADRDDALSCLNGYLLASRHEGMSPALVSECLELIEIIAQERGARDGHGIMSSEIDELMRDIEDEELEVGRMVGVAI